jgi:hypothetical protein
MQASDRWLPASIVLAGGMIAVALYLALRPAPSHEPGSAPTEHTWAEPSPDASERRRDSPFEHREGRRDEASTPAEIEREIARPDARQERRSSAAEAASAIAPPLAMMPTVSPELLGRVTDDATRAVVARRSEIRSQCWDALPDAEDAPAEVPLGLSISFDASGKVLASGVSEDRETARAGVAACVGPIVHSLEIPPPGANVGIELSITVP